MADSENRSGSFYLNNNSNNNNSNDNYYINVWGFPGGSVVKNPPAEEETQVWPLGQEDPLDKEMVAHSCILAWEKVPLMISRWLGWALPDSAQSLLGNFCEWTRENFFLERPGKRVDS